jgi:hypothetical protein
MNLRALAKRDPPLFLQRFPPPILIDEVQYAPGSLRRRSGCLNGVARKLVPGPCSV